MLNQSAERLTGYSNDTLLGRRVDSIVSRERIGKIIETIRGRGSISLAGYPTVITDREGKDIPVKLRVSPLRGSGGGIIGFLLIFVDLREIEELRMKLLEAERLAAITEMAICVNHEINNPLCSILGNTQLMLMERDKLQPEMVRKLRSIERQIQRIQKVARELGKIKKPVLKEYVDGSKMLDVEASTSSDKSFSK
jgi:PAS domain S-box-containing protein